MGISITILYRYKAYIDIVAFSGHENSAAPVWRSNADFEASPSHTIIESPLFYGVVLPWLHQLPHQALLVILLQTTVLSLSHIIFIQSSPAITLTLSPNAEVVNNEPLKGLRDGPVQPVQRYHDGLLEYAQTLLDTVSIIIP